MDKRPLSNCCDVDDDDDDDVEWKSTSELKQL